MVQKTVFLIRHGQPEDGYTKRFLGRLNPGLSPEGREQARRLAGHMADLRPEVCFSSPLKRARHTADIVANACGLTVRESDLLMEIDFGELEGKTFDEARSLYPETTDSWQALSSDFSFPGGEDFAGFNARVDALADEVRSLEAERIALVAHGGVLRGLLCNLLDLPANGPIRFRFAYAAITSVELLTGDTGVLTGFNVGVALP